MKSDLEKYKKSHRGFISKLNINIDIDTKTRWVAFCRANKVRQSALLSGLIKEFLDEQEKQT